MPQHRREPVHPQQELPLPPRRDKPGVLVVDGDPLVRVMVHLGLERNGFEVWLATSRRQAVELYHEHKERIAVVLLDVRVPTTDGLATLHALRELNPAVRACFLSCDGSAFQPEELIRGGAAYVIVQPIGLDALANILRLLANGVPADLLPAGGGSPG
jgi:DNA-binding NarL/FixJ family response regulator